MSVTTRALPFLTELHGLFYDARGIKGIPDATVMYELLSPIALAVWIGGDGTWVRTSTVLCTDSFTPQDVIKLMNILNIRYGLECTLFFHEAKRIAHPRIRIKTRSIPQLRSIVLQHLHPSMHYKLGI